MAHTFATKSFVFRFADVTVREREFAILKAGRLQQVEPKAFRVLLMLIQNPNKLIAKEELLTRVWRDTAVTENSLARNIALLRRLLGDDAREPRFIETVSSIGYRFLCPVEATEEPTGNLDITAGSAAQGANGHIGPSADLSPLRPQEQTVPAPAKERPAIMAAGKKLWLIVGIVGALA